MDIQNLMKSLNQPQRNTLKIKKEKTHITNTNSFVNIGYENIGRSESFDSIIKNTKNLDEFNDYDPQSNLQLQFQNNTSSAIMVSGS